MVMESVVRLDASSIKYGAGATREVGSDMSELGVKRVMVVTDPYLAKTEAVSIALDSLRKAGIEADLFSDVRIEPTDTALRDIIEYAVNGRFDGFLAIGGGSSMDTAKIANLYSTYPADFLTYVNAPLGKGIPVPGPVKPMICIPTTSGTGSETTGVAVFDMTELHVKTAIAHRHLRPLLGILDPENTRTMPKMVAVCTGFDVLAHAMEAYTAIPFDQRTAPESPALRPAYQGANPLSDVWAAKAIEMAGNYFIRSIEDPSDSEARSQMILASTFAGIGFGNAGTQLGHGMSYPVSGMVREYIPEDYPTDHAIIPHGMAVTLTAPARFRFTAPANPQRHLETARLAGADITDCSDDDAGEILANRIITLMKETGMPNGLSAVGFTEKDVDKLVEGTLPQQRITKLSPRPFTPDDLKKMFLDSFTCW